MPPDDPSIAPETQLYRRLHASQLIWDHNEHRLRPTSNAFKDPEMSVNLGDAMERANMGVEYLLRFDPDHHLASITAALARGNGQAIWRDPLVEHEKYGDDPTHGIVEGRKKGARANTFAKQARVDVVRPHSLGPEARAQAEGHTA